MSFRAAGEESFCRYPTSERRAGKQHKVTYRGFAGLLQPLAQAGVEAQRIVEEDFSFQFLAHVASASERGNVFSEVSLIPLVRIVRSPDNRIRSDDLCG